VSQRFLTTEFSAVAASEYRVHGVVLNNGAYLLGFVEGEIGKFDALVAVVMRQMICDMMTHVSMRTETSSIEQRDTGVPATTGSKPMRIKVVGRLSVKPG